MNDVKKYFDKYDNLEEIIYNNKSKNEEQILIELKNDLNEISQCKELVNKSKSLMIKINKSKNLLKIKQKLEKNINLNINLLNHHQLEVLNNIMKEYKLFLNIEYDKLNYKIENIISNVDHFDHLDFYSLINFKKNKKNNLEKLIYACNNKTSSYELPKTIFLEHLEIFDNQNNIMQFLKKFHFDFKSNKIKQLKRGFIFEMKKNNQSFIIKYQPNKSFSEIIMNKYLSKYNHLKQFILYPDYIFINKNNSYFYVMQKYNSDLFHYIKKKTKPLEDITIIKIIQFLIQAIYQLHNINIIYGDVKLENIILKYSENNIHDIKLIDFDVSLFNEIPNEFIHFDKKIVTLFENKKPRGTKLYMSTNKEMSKSSDIYSIGVFIIIFFYKNILKILQDNNDNIGETLNNKIKNKLVFYKNKMEDDVYKIKLMKYIFRILNDKRFHHYWNHQISMKKIYLNVKKCIHQDINIHELYDEFVKYVV